jgi:uracil-DNA glycosylase
LGNQFRITVSRGKILSADNETWVLATWHPSAILRAPDPDQRHMMRAQFIADLHAAARAVV